MTLLGLTTGQPRRPVAAASVIALASLTTLVGCGGKSPAAPELTPGNLSITAHVVGDGLPIANTPINLSQNPGFQILQTNTTGPQGEVRFSGLSPGQYRLQAGRVFGFLSPLSMIDLQADLATDLVLNPADDIESLCIRANDSGCLRDGDTVEWPVVDLRVDGRWRGASYPWPQRPGIGVHVTLAGGVDSTLPVSETGIRIIDMQSDESGATSAGDFRSRFRNDFYPCNCGLVLVDECTTLLCHARFTLRYYVTSPAPPGGGTVNILATEPTGFTLNTVRRPSGTPRPPGPSKYDGIWSGTGTGTTAVGTSATSEVSFTVINGTVTSFTMPFRLTPAPGSPSGASCVGTGSLVNAQITFDGFNLFGASAGIPMTTTGSFSSPTAVSGTATLTKANPALVYCSNATITWTASRR